MKSFPYLSPINRGMLASVVQELDKRKVRSVALDVLLDRPTTTGEDQALAAAFSAAKAPIVVVTDPGLEGRNAVCAQDAVSSTRSSAPVLPLFQDKVATGNGVICLDPLDDVTRTARFAGTMPRTFVEAILGATGDENRAGNLVPVPFAVTENRTWPFPTFSAAHLSALPDTWFEDRIVLVGQISPYSSDWWLTPLRYRALAHQITPAELMPQGKVPGVVVHAYALEAALSGKRGPQPHFLTQFIVALLGACVGAALVLTRGNWALTIGALGAALAGAWLLVFYVYAWGGPLLPFMPAALGVVITAGISIALQETRERAQKNYIHLAFSHFLAPPVVDQLMREPEKLRLEATEREISVLFTDLQGFTRLVDTMDGPVISKSLNGYLDIIVEAVMEEGGVVDKIVGDAIHAIFSAPIEDPEHRLRAARCALTIRKRTSDYQKQMQDQGLNFGITRIGINAGNALVGNFGAGRRLDYTAHGSTINLAARLEAANKLFGTIICVSEESKVGYHSLAYREIGPVILRGVDHAMTVYELFSAGERSDADLAAYARGMAMLQAGDHGAKAIFEDLLCDDPEDGLVQFQLERLKEESLTDFIRA